MAVDYIKKITLTKDDLEKPVFKLVQNDQQTSALQLNISRYDSKIDLSTLGWSIKIKNADGDVDTQTFIPTVSDAWLIYDWTFPQIVGAAVGETTFQIEGVNDDDVRVWQSGKRIITVIENLDASGTHYEPSELSLLQQAVYNTTEKLSEMNTQIDGFEERISDAVDSANEATDNANAATDNANTAVETANAAVTAANTAVTSANNAATIAETATAEANAATEKANTAISEANTAAENANAATEKATTATTECEYWTDSCLDAIADAKTAESSARSAAQLANTNANKAETLGQKADNAATTAVSATTNANNAATKANTAATAANTAADNANAAAASVVSPTVSVAETTDGHKLTITDKNGTTETEIPDGKDWTPTETELDELASDAAEKLQPTISEISEKIDYATKTADEAKAGLSAKQDSISDLETIRSGAAKGATSVQSLDGYATETYVDGKVADIVKSAPETLDTLKELADALGDDPNFATTVANQIGNKQDTITDLDNIRSGASKGATALQSVPSTYRTAAQQDAIHDSTKQDTISDLNDIREGAAKGATALQSYTETDPTVPSWAKAETKPSYTAAEVHALPDTTEIPSDEHIYDVANPDELPDGWVKCTGLVGDGTTYIDTGIIYDDTIQAKVTISQSTLGGAFGCVQFSGSSLQRSIGIGIIKSGNKNLVFVGCGRSLGYDGANEVTLDGSEVRTFAVFNKLNSRVGVSREFVYTFTGVASIGTTTETITLFKLNHGSTFSSFGLSDDPITATIYECTIYKGGSLVRNFIPCFDDSLVPCMYDTVTKKGFYNAASSGSFKVEL